MLDEFGVEAATVVRTRDELEGVIERNPIPDGPSIPKLFQVTFFSDEPDAGAVAKLVEQDFGDERVEVIGREAYAWHPDGIQKSKLARELGKRLRARRDRPQLEHGHEAARARRRLAAREHDRAGGGDQHRRQRRGLGTASTVRSRPGAQCHARWSAENSANAVHTGTMSSRDGRHAAHASSSAKPR